MCTDLNLVGSLPVDLIDRSGLSFKACILPCGSHSYYTVVGQVSSVALLRVLAAATVSSNGPA